MFEGWAVYFSMVARQELGHFRRRVKSICSSEQSRAGVIADFEYETWRNTVRIRCVADRVCVATQLPMRLPDEIVRIEVAAMLQFLKTAKCPPCIERVDAVMSRRG